MILKNDKNTNVKIGYILNLLLISVFYTKYLGVFAEYM